MPANTSLSPCRHLSRSEIVRAFKTFFARQAKEHDNVRYLSHIVLGRESSPISGRWLMGQQETVQSEKGQSYAEWYIGRDGNPTIKRQLWHEMRRALAEVTSGAVLSLVEAPHLVRNRDAILGRRVPKRCISRTVLLKGLECEHAVVIDADSMDARNLYVAITRGSKSLHILSRERILWPTDARRSCPRCNSRLALKTGPNGSFLACSTHPACPHTESLNGA